MRVELFASTLRYLSLETHSVRYDHGIQTFHTADGYSNGLSEVMLGKAIKELKPPRDELVILTKNQYSLVYGEEEREMFLTLKLFGVGTIPYSLLGRGLLAQPMSAQTQLSDSEDVGLGVGLFKEWAGTNDIVNRLLSHGSSRRTVSVYLFWRSITVPIVGTTSVEKLEELLGALDVELTADEVKYFEEPYKPLAVHGFA
ncbi:hypothetical protein DAEQUDRAFT_767111 [Daedalea quercina L-15889]|uniref:NADP-dependent oxidoreductase domain-containing protein n=1 Tax=Daedalea quercina L-15889 TaxID=1314783 RepID=A0A165NZ22_9APHY|nr:hypothetical protein DAEQUDRAFT_767111 [Daedalea quercina L-15889]